MPISMKSVKSKMTREPQNKQSDEKYTTYHAEESEHNIAVIGLACKFASADNEKEFWEVLRRGEDCIHPYPKRRKKYGDEFLRHQIKYPVEDGYYEGGFLNEVDKFDNEVFPISKMEVSLMSPEQRNFLQIAWAAMENAGYGGEKSKGTHTGVFLGNSTDFGVPYKEFIDVLNPELSSIAISGNLNGIIASRISFFNDWKGPAIDIDTACSSSLTAIHLACKSLRDGECEMAVVGAAKIDNLPLKSIKNKEDQLGITSADGRTKTFDYTSDGTGLGEGIGVIVLKKLSKAVSDGDNIRAIIKGSAINHDGQSANLTAPNPIAQEEVIVSALKDAHVKPDTISYIEAHGTGTKLGDPIEIKGITEAYRRFTEKKQFCAIGSVKSNIGHLDNAAGMAGIIKLILSLEHKKLPPTIHYTKANENINFEDSPVYVNTKYCDWISNGEPRRCGISAFGLSGTNCHIILEEAPEQHKVKKTETEKYIFMLSAANKARLMDYIWEYQQYLYQNTDVDAGDISYTAATGRMHYEARLAIVYQSVEELRSCLELAAIHQIEGLEEQNIFYGYYKIVGEQQKLKQDDEITIFDKNRRTAEALELINKQTLKMEELQKIAVLYCEGATIDGVRLYDSYERKFNRLKLPTYPYEQKSYWIETKVQERQMITNEPMKEHPLLHHLIADSYDRITYGSRFTVEDDWILNEHIVAGVPVIPGTVYLEMAVVAAKKIYDCKAVELKDVAFLEPLSLEAMDIGNVQTIIQEENGIHFCVVSRSSKKQEWTTHVRGQILLVDECEEEVLDLEAIKARCPGEKLKEFPYENGEAIELGKRWDCIDRIMAGKNEALVHFKLQPEFSSEAKEYYIHPALLDEAVNVPLRTIGKGVYLPFSYKSLLVKQPFTDEVYSYTKWESGTGSEVASFDVVFTDASGRVIAKATEYSIKRVHEMTWKSNLVSYKKNWIQAKREFTEQEDKNIAYLVLHADNGSKIEPKLLAFFKKEKNAIILNVLQEDIDLQLQKLSGFESYHIINVSMLNLKRNSYVEEEKQFQSAMKGMLQVLQYLSEQRPGVKIRLTEIGNNGYEVNGAESIISPYSAAYHTLNCAIANEFTHMFGKAIDIDEETNQELLIQEIFTDSEDSLIVSYRGNQRMVPVLEPVTLKEQNQKVTVKEDGVYVITGGMGGMGLEVSRWFASKASVKLVLISHSAFPKRDTWDSICRENKEKKRVQQITKVRQIEESGSKVFLYHADVTDEDALIKVLSLVRKEIGEIKGVIHAAGVAGDGFLLRKDQQQIDRVMLPKMKGAWQLAQAIEEDHLDFFVMTSSISALIPEAGQSDYAAANSFMDSLVTELRKRKIPAFTVNWPAWKETGMAVEYQVDFSKEVFEPIGNEEAKEAFFRIISQEHKQVILGKVNFDNYQERKKAACISLNKQQNKGNLYRRIRLENSKEDTVANLTKIILTGDRSYSKEEEDLAQVIGKVLGLTEVNVFNSFTELGGNSIIAVKAEIDLEEAGYQISLNDLFSNKTIRELAMGTEESKKEASKKEDKSEGQVITGIEPFTDLIYKGCFFSAWIPVLKKYERNYMNAIINDVISFQFMKENDLLSFTTVYKPMEDLEQCAAEMNIQIEQKEESTDIIHDLIEAIDRKHPVIICIDCFYSSIRADVYQKEHWPHNLLVYGYEKTKKNFYVIEHKNSGSILYKKQEISFQDVEDAYRGYLKEYGNLDIVNSNVYDLIFTEGKRYSTYYECCPIDGKEELSNADILKKYLAYEKNAISFIMQGQEELIYFLDNVKELISNKELLLEKCEGIIEVISKIVTSRTILQYRSQILYGGDHEFTVKRNALVKKWGDIRSMLVKFYYKKSYHSQWVYDIDEQLSELKEMESAFTKLQEAVIRNEKE